MMVPLVILLVVLRLHRISIYWPTSLGCTPPVDWFAFAAQTPAHFSKLGLGKDVE